MKRWKQSGLVRGFLLVVLAVSVLMDVLSGMYFAIGKDYAATGGKAGKDFFVSQEEVLAMLDGYIRLFEEYMQIGSLITTDGEIDYNKEILVSLLDDKSYTIQDLLKNPSSEGEAVEQFRTFMEDFEQNCYEGKSYPWYTRFSLQMEQRIVLEDNNIFQFDSSNVAPVTEKQLKNMKKYRKNMVAVSRDKGEEDAKRSEVLHFPLYGEQEDRLVFTARSSYEEYLIEYFPDYARIYYLEKIEEAYEDSDNEVFMKAYQDYYKGKSMEGTEEQFYQKVQRSREQYEEKLPPGWMPWRVHKVPVSIREAKEFVVFLVETYQEMRYFFSRSNFVFGYENTKNLLLTNHQSLWEGMKAAADRAETEPVSDSDRLMYAYFKASAYAGTTNFLQESFLMSGNVLEKLEEIGANYSGASYLIGVGLDLRGIADGKYEDKFAMQYEHSHQVLQMLRIGKILGIGVIFTIISFFLLASMYGSGMAGEKGVLKWYDRVWTELQLLAVGVMAGMVQWLFTLWDRSAVPVLICFFSFFMAVLCYLCLGILLSIIKKARLHCGVRHSITGLFLSEVLFRKMGFREWVALMRKRFAFLPAKQKYIMLFLFEFIVLAYFAGSMVFVRFDRRVSVSSFFTSLPGWIFLVLGIGFCCLLSIWQAKAWKNEEADLLIIEGMQKIMEGDFRSQLPNLSEAGYRKMLLGDSVNGMGEALERAVEESVRSERMKTELIANVSHDIKTPLTSVLDYVDLMKREGTENETMQKYIEVLERKAQRLKTLLEDLVEASKASSGVMELEIGTLNFNELIRQTNGEFEDRFEECHLELVSELPEETLFFQGDGRRVFRILENLYNNTAKYAMPHTRVYVSLVSEGDALVFRIKNISASRLNITPEELTERFVRGDRSRTTEGSGLGLSIAKSLTELMEGTFAIELDGDLFCAVVYFPQSY